MCFLFSKAMLLVVESLIEPETNGCDCLTVKYFRTTTTKEGEIAPLSPQVKAELWLFYYFSPACPDERAVFHLSSLPQP